MRRDERSRFPLIDVDYSPDMDFWKNIPETFAVQMAFIQNLFIRCLNSIYYNAIRVKKEDESAFVGYCLAWLEALYRHRNGEEGVIFPFIRKRYDLFQNPSLDYGFDETMKTMELYLKNVKDGTDHFDGRRIRQLVEAFGDDLVEHLHNNIPALSEERLSEYDIKDVETMFSKLESHSKEQVSIAFGFILAINHHDRNRYPTWPPLPKAVRWFAENVAYWWHKDFWKFAPYTRRGEPKEYNGRDTDSVRSGSTRMTSSS